MTKNKNSSKEIESLKERLAKYQKKYADLLKQSPERWWHDEHFDNQLRVWEAAIGETKKQIADLKKKK